MLCLSYYLLCFLFNKIGEEGITGSVCLEARGVRGMGGEAGGRKERWLKQCMHIRINELTIKKSKWYLGLEACLKW
jgi:hypothetical protein